MKMKPEILLVLLPLLVTITGCPQVDTLRPSANEPAYLENLLQNRQYKRALQLLAGNPTLDSPANRERIILQMRNFENITIAEAQALQDEEDLAQAIERLEGAISVLPEENRLQPYLYQLIQQRDARLHRNDRQFLLARARYHVGQYDYYQEQTLLKSPSYSQRLRKQLHDRDTDELANGLLECGKQALRDKQMEVAGECLELGSRIRNDEAMQSAYQEWKSTNELLLARAEKTPAVRKTAPVKRVARASTKPDPEQIRQDQIKQYRVETEMALNDSDLLGAQQSLLRLEETGASEEIILPLQTRLGIAIQSRVDSLLLQGNRQYRADAIEQAMQSWQQALRLDPDNLEAKERLERAGKVLEKLRELEDTALVN